MNEYGTLKLSDFGLAKKIVDLIQTSEGKGEPGVSYRVILDDSNSLKKALLITWHQNYSKMKEFIVSHQIFGHWVVSSMSLLQESHPSPHQVSMSLWG